MPSKPAALVFAFLLGALCTLVPGLAAPGAEELDQAFEAFWAAKKPAEADSAIAAILALAPGFDTALERLRKGRSYSSDVETGLLLRTRKPPYHYAVLVPEGYRPTRRYPVTFFLHGGVSRPPFARDGSWWYGYDRVKSEDQIAVIPAAWNAAKWWDYNQFENLDAILKAIKREYNVDENRVAMFGISDGGTGAYAFAFRAPTPWASFLPIIGHPGVLRSMDLYIANLVHRPFFIANTGKDRLYPSASVRPFIEAFRRAGAEVTFIEKAQEGHNMNWWPEEEDRAQAFLDAHPRDPLPEKLAWETDRTDRYHRFSWLLITGLGRVPGESALKDVNSLSESAPAIFARGRASGRVELERRGNRVVARTRGVRSFRLLIAPDEFDLAHPVTVRVNGREAFHGPVEADLETLLRGAVRDQDRTMLFAAELEIEVPTRRAEGARRPGDVPRREAAANDRGSRILHRSAEAALNSPPEKDPSSGTTDPGRR